MAGMITRRSLGASGLAYGATAAVARAATSPKPAKLVALVSDTYGPWISKFGRDWTETSGIPVEVISQAYDQTYSKIVASLAGGSPFDIVIVDCVWTSAFATAKFLRPLTAEISPFAVQLIPAAINERKVDGQIYAMPLTSDGKFFYYNSELLQKGGYGAPPETWEELGQMSRAMQQKGIVKHGIVWAWKQAEGLMCDYTLLTAGMKGSIQDANGAWHFQEGGGLDALKFMVSQLKEGVADPASLSLNDRQIVDSFDGGSVAFMLSWSFAFSIANNPASSPVAGKVKMALVPGFAAAGTTSSTVTGGSGLGVTTSSKVPHLAWDLIRFVSDRRHELDVMSFRTNMPVWKSLYNDPAMIKAFPHIQQMAKQFDYAVWRPNLPKYAQISSILQREIHSALSGESMPERALAAALTQIKAVT